MTQTADRSQYPEYTDIEGALQLLLFKRGGNECALRAADTYEPLANIFRLSTNARTATCAERLKGDPNRKDKTPYWHKLVQFARLRLVKKGDLHRMAGLGLWKLTKQGKRHAVKLAASASAAPGLRANMDRRKSQGRRTSDAHAQL